MIAKPYKLALTSWVYGENKLKMAFHPGKSNVLFITCNKTTIKYEYQLHGHKLEHVEGTKYLGITIQSDLKWEIHINSICNKANTTLGFLRRYLNTRHKLSETTAIPHPATHIPAFVPSLILSKALSE